jgi:1,4-alpha-glucan branching enzyme
LGRAPGEYEQKFAGARAFMVYMMTYPGKKLSFMGNEIAQFSEWDHEKTVEWQLLDFGMHSAFQLFSADLNHFYLENPSLWRCDADPSGFAWIDADNAEWSICSYRRMDERGRELLVVINFTPVERTNFLLAVPDDGVYEELFNSDDLRYGGRGVQNLGKLRAEPHRLSGLQNAVRITLPASSALILRRSRKASKRK